jgi:cytochrome c
MPNHRDCQLCLQHVRARPLAALALLAATLASTLAMTLAATPALAQNADDGKAVFNKCRACHQVGPGARNLVGPSLNGLIGRKAGTVEGFNYSEANKSSGIVWDEATFREYIKNPKAKIPNTKMVFPGITDEKDINDLLAFLEQYSADGKTK